MPYGSLGGVRFIWQRTVAAANGAGLEAGSGVTPSPAGRKGVVLGGEEGDVGDHCFIQAPELAKKRHLPDKYPVRRFLLNM